jgi:hypothetical protein
VAPGADGTLPSIPANSPAGRLVDLRFEMDTLVLLHTCPHPMNPAAEYPRKPVRWLQFPRPAPVAADDFCLNSRPENGRGFANNRNLSSLRRCAGHMLKESTLTRGKRCIASHSRRRLLDRHRAPRADPAHRRSGGQSGRRYAVLQRRRPGRALQRGRHHPRTGQCLSRLGSKLLSTEGQCDAGNRRRHGRPHDTLGGACATESNTVRYALEKRTMHSCRDSWLLAVASTTQFG